MFFLRTGQIDWKWNSYATFFEDSFKCIEDSQMANDWLGLQSLFEDFFAFYANRNGLYVRKTLIRNSILSH
jgi:hypothetical protein